MDKNQKENIIDLLKLIIENPELEILPMVATDCVLDDTFAYWGASWGKAKIDEYWVCDERIYFKSQDFDFLVEEWMDDYCNDYPDLSEDEFRKLAEKEIESREWVKAIVVRIKP